MEVTVEKSTGLQRKLTVKVPSANLEQKMDERLREIGKQVKIKGFRPGRIPSKVLKQRYGKSVQQEVVSQLVQSSLVKAIEQESLRLASSPVLDSVSELGAGDDLEFTASVEVYPEIGTIDVSSAEIKRPETAVTDQDVDDMLQTLREQRQTWESTESPAAEGNQAVVEYVADAGGTRIPEQGHQRLSLVLGTSGFSDLEKAVKGMKAGDEKKLKLKFPEAYGDSQLAGKKAKVELKVTTVQLANIPEIDEEFIKSFAVESGQMDDLRAEVRANLERELEQATKGFLKSQVVTQILGIFEDLEVPESIVRQESQSLARRAAEQRGVEVDSVDAKLFLDAATRRVRSGLLLAEAARQNKIVIDGARVRKAIETVAETYEQPMEVVQMYYGNQQLLQGVENMILEEQVVDWVLEQAKVTAEPMAFKDVINAAATTGQ